MPRPSQPLPPPPVSCIRTQKGVLQKGWGEPLKVWLGTSVGKGTAAAKHYGKNTAHLLAERRLCGEALWVKKNLGVTGGSPVDAWIDERVQEQLE